MTAVNHFLWVAVFFSLVADQVAQEVPAFVGDALTCFCAWSCGGRAVRH